MGRQKSLHRERSEIEEALHERRFHQAYRICETLDQRLGKKTDPEIYFYGSCALLGLGHVRQAEQWVERYRQRGGESVRFLYLEAFLRLHRGRLDEALLSWTRILALDPSETFADGLIEKLREHPSTIEEEIRRPSSFLKYVPIESSPEEQGGGEETPSRQRSSPQRIVSRGSRRLFLFSLIPAGTLLVGAVLGILFFLYRRGEDPLRKLEERLPGTPAQGTVIPAGEFAEDPPRFLYETRREVVAEYEKARRLISGGEVNQGRYLLAKIEYSNASFEFKERARLLRDFIPWLPPSRFSDSVGVSTLLKEPLLYRGVQILWRGRIGPQLSGERGTGQLFYPDGGEREIYLNLGRVHTYPTDLKEGETVDLSGYYRELDEKERPVIEVRTLERIR